MLHAANWVVVTATAMLALGCDALGTAHMPSPADGRASPTRTKVVTVSGVLDPSGDRLVRLNPVVRRVVTGPAPSSASGRYILRVSYDGERQMDYRFDGLVSDDAGHTQHGFFELNVTEDEPIAELTIVDTRHDTVLAIINGTEIVE